MKQELTNLKKDLNSSNDQLALRNLKSNKVDTEVAVDPKQFKPSILKSNT